MATSSTDHKLHSYENKNWAMLIEADPDHPLEPGTKNGVMLILIQNVSGKPMTLNSYIGLTYRTSNTPGQIVFTTPWEKTDELNTDTAVGGTFAPDGLPGDKVFLTINPPVDGKSEFEAHIRSIEQDRKVWDFLPPTGWTDGTDYTVSAHSQLDERSSAPTTRKFKAVAPKPSVVILNPGKEGAVISPTSRIVGSYGGTVKKSGGITAKLDGAPQSVSQDTPVKGTWSVEPQSNGWDIGDDHRIEVVAQNDSESSEPAKCTFKVKQIHPGKPRITTPPKQPASSYTMYSPPHLAGVVEPRRQDDKSLQGPCDKVTVSHLARQVNGNNNLTPTDMTAKLEYNPERDVYTWSLEADWSFSDEGIQHEVEVRAWLGDVSSEPDDNAKIKFVMKTPALNDNPIQFTSPKRDNPEADSHVKISGYALKGTPYVTISESKSTDADSVAIRPLGIVNTTQGENVAKWSWTPTREWAKEKHTIIVTASKPNQKNDISFTVMGPPNVTISIPQEGATANPYSTLSGRLPRDARSSAVTIEDTCDGKDPQSFSALNRGDRTFHYEPSPGGEGWRAGRHSVVAKAGTYTSVVRNFTVTGKKVVIITSKDLTRTGTINFQIPDSWNKLEIKWTDSVTTETVVSATKEQVAGHKPSGYPNWPFNVYQPPQGYWKNGTYTLKCWDTNGKLLGEDSKSLRVH